MVVSKKNNNKCPPRNVGRREKSPSWETAIEKSGSQKKRGAKIDRSRNKKTNGKGQKASSAGARNIIAPRKKAPKKVGAKRQQGRSTVK